MNKTLMYSYLSPLYPLMGRFTVKIRTKNIETITPLRGQGVMRNKTLITN